MAHDALVAELMAAQERRGETNSAFARLLGIHRVYWIGVKRGRYRPGPKIELGAIRLRAEEAVQRQGEQRGA